MLRIGTLTTGTASAHKKHEQAYFKIVGSHVVGFAAQFAVDFCNTQGQESTRA